MNSQPADGGDPYSVPTDADVTADEVIAHLARVVAGVVDDHRALAERIEELEQDDPRIGRHGRLRVERLDEQQATDVHAELVRWVCWMVTVYRMQDVVPACWQRHDAIVEELAAFYATWLAVWDDDGRYDGGISWHEQLHRARDRLTRWDQGTICGKTCRLDIELNDRTAQQWTDGGERCTAEDRGCRLRRARTVVPAPLPPARKKNTANTKKTAAVKPGKAHV